MQDLVFKNNDLLPKNISSGLFKSRSPLVQNLFPEGNAKRSMGHRRPTSQTATLRTQITTLLQTITPRKPHYVFCIAPNDRRLSSTFDLALVQHQVRVYSLLPLVRLWRAGHCHYVDHHRFVMRYKMLCPLAWPNPTQVQASSLVEVVAQIVRCLPLPSAEFTIGIRKLFVRSPRTVSM